MLVLTTLIIIPIIGHFMCIDENQETHLQGTQNHEIVYSMLGDLSEHCCDEHSQHEINLIGSSSFTNSHFYSISGFQRPENIRLISHFPLSEDRPPSI